jgi:predicted RND superfamily exporter protein
MTITIAAINIGIGVDDSIHYIHRFREEFKQDENHWNAIHRCHDSIARAMYYTSVTVVLGFSILALSNFIPTIYFGVLSGLAMITALIANLMLLPVLIARFRLS